MCGTSESRPPDSWTVTLDALNDYRDDFLIRVRVCRIRESTNPNTGEEYSFNMILINEKDNKLSFSDICLLVILL